MVIWGILAGCIGLGVNLFHPYKIPYIRKPPPPKVVDETIPDPQEISFAEAEGFYQTGDYLFVDARSAVQYRKGHIAGAISLPWEEYETYFPQVKPLLESKPGIVVYCSGEACDLSHALGKQLIKEGFSEVYVFFGGYEIWKEMGLPVEEEE